MARSVGDRSDQAVGQKQANTKKFLEWHASLPKEEKTKFNRFVSETNRGKSIGTGAVRRRRAAAVTANGNRGKSNYRSSVGDGDGKLQRSVGDAFSRNNPSSIPNAAASGAENLISAIGRRLSGNNGNRSGSKTSFSDSEKNKRKNMTREELIAYNARKK